MNHSVAWSGSVSVGTSGGLLDRWMARIGRSEQAKSKLWGALWVLGGSLLVAGLAQIQIPLPFTPVPLTGQTLGVLLVGATLGSRRAFKSMALYVVEGAIGLPFFAGGASGLSRLLGPTGGYLIGFIFAATLVGWLMEKGSDRKWLRLALGLLAAHTVVFAFGVSWLSFFVGFEKALAAGYLPFIPGEILKVTFATIMICSVRKPLA